MKNTIFNIGTAIILILVTASISAEVQAYADLSVQYVSVYNAAYNPGDLILVTNHIKNVGTTSSNSYTVSFYASTNTLITSADYYLGSVSRSSLAAGATHYYFTIPSLPYTLPIGNYYIGLIVSCSNDFIMSNNTGYDGPIEVSHFPSGSADISVESVNVPNGTYAAGDEVVVGSLLENQGSVHSESFTVDIYASTDRTIAPGDYLMGSTVWSGLSVGESHASDTTARFPDNIPSGKYYVGMRIYCANDSNTGNNRRYDYQKITIIGGIGPEPEPEPDPDPDTPPPPPPPVIPPDLSVLSVDATNGTYEPGDEIKVTTRIKNIGGQSSGNYTVKYYASGDRTITTSDYLLVSSSTRSGLGANTQQSFTTSKHFPPDIPTGNYYIGVIVTCSNDSNSSNNKGYDSTTVRIIQPIQSGRIHGRITYTDRNNRTHPVRYALVKITDNAALNRTNEQRYTDSNGEYEVNLAYDIRGRIITLKVSTEGKYQNGLTTSNICKVQNQDSVLKTVYSKTNTSSVGSQNSSVVINLNIPENTSGSNRGAFNIYDSVVEGFLKARSVLGITPSTIDVEWPAEGASYNWRDYGATKWIQLHQDDRWDRDVILHEYGHFIAHTYDFAQGDSGDDPNHWWRTDTRYDYPDHNRIRTDEEAMNLAFSEAWATFFSVAVQYDNKEYPNSGDTNFDDTGNQSLSANIENRPNLNNLADLNNLTSSAYLKGEYYEWLNCCVLWDIFDNNRDNNDSMSDPSLDKIWTIMLRNTKPEDIKDFWNSWKQRYSSDTSSINNIFKYHKMTFVP